MSLTLTTDVFCDGIQANGEPCPQWTEGVTGPHSDAKGARASARRAGWTTGRKDYCPECQKAIKDRLDQAEAGWPNNRRDAL